MAIYTAVVNQNPPCCAISVIIDFNQARTRVHNGAWHWQNAVAMLQLSTQSANLKQNDG